LRLVRSSFASATLLNRGRVQLEQISKSWVVRPPRPWVAPCHGIAFTPSCLPPAQDWAIVQGRALSVVLSGPGDPGLRQPTIVHTQPHSPYVTCITACADRKVQTGAGDDRAL